MTNGNGKFAPQDKKPGDLILSADWNKAMQEVVRLEGDKINRKGADTIQGSLTITEAFQVNGNFTLGRGRNTIQGSLAIAESLQVNGNFTLGRGINTIQGSLAIAEALQVNGNVGIGTGTRQPQAKLEVYGGRLRVATQDEAAVIELSNSSKTNYIFTNGSSEGTKGDLYIRTDSAAHDVILQAGGIAQGNVGIGTNIPSAKLQVVGGAIMPSAGNTENAGIMFPKDPGGGGSDAAWMRYYPRTGEACTLEIGISNDGDDHIALISSGGVGIGTRTPLDTLHVEGGLRILGNSNPIRFTNGWSNFTDGGINQAEISNDTGDHKTLMIVGNRSAGLGRRVSVWDRLEVNGSLVINGEKPIEVIKYSNVGDDINYRTGYRTSDWICSIAGFASGIGDINEDGSGEIIKVFTYPGGDGFWYLRADFFSHNRAENWTIWLMAVRTTIARAANAL